MIEEFEDFILVNKKPGENFHSEFGEEGLFHQLKEHYGELYPVHRLDKVTSGLLLMARNLQSCQELNQLFEAQKIEKFYLAISDRKPKKKQGWVIGDMEKSRRGGWKLCESRKNPAVTQFFSYSIGQGKRVYLLRPRTGKTHQLRVAMKALGAPICGDPNYYPGLIKGHEDRCCLHAYSIRFTLKGHEYQFIQKPHTGTYFSDETFLKVLEEQYLRPWDLNWPEKK